VVPSSGVRKRRTTTKTEGLRALAIALLAVSLSLVGPGAIALASQPGGFERQVRDGKDAQPFVARPAPPAVRVALRPRGTSLDDHGGRQLAVELTARARDGAAVSPRFLSGRAPRCNARRFPETVRSSRGPPQG
jgi:hypothetical protein